MLLSLGVSVWYWLAPGMGLGETALVWAVIGGLEVSSYPLMDAMAIQFINDGVPIRYSLGRGLGSLAYALTCVFLGFQVGRSGVESTLLTHVVLVAAEIALVATYPPYRGRPRARDAEGPRPQSALALLRSNPSFTLMLAGVLLSLTAVLPLSNFLVNIVTSRGGTDADLGLAMFCDGGLRAAHRLSLSTAAPPVWQRAAAGAQRCVRHPQGRGAAVYLQLRRRPAGRLDLGYGRRKLDAPLHPSQTGGMVHDICGIFCKHTERLDTRWRDKSMNMRKTKIICTLGPAVDHAETIERLIRTGMNAARFNFSHGSHAEQLARLNMFKKVRDTLGAPVATILDTKGPEIRIKTFADGPVTLEQGQGFILTTDDVPGDGRRVSVTYANLHKEVGPGCRILVDDGLIELRVQKVEGHEIHCEVENGGPLSSNKSINIPDVHILLPSLTDKDREDLKFAVDNDFDFIAASFVRKASDVEDIRAELRKHGGDNIRIIAKIENREGVENLEGIIAASDGIMVARGDLGVEIPAHEVPILQKKMIKATIRAGLPVITATQMLDSMIRNPRPTRAEVSDVANAVFDGTSCVMLSGETASGKYPIEALSTMVNTVTAAEEAIDYWGRFRERSLFARGIRYQ